MSLEAKNIVSGYGKLEVLHGATIRAEKSKITSILGPNGAGKSTLLKTIFGYLKPWDGSVRFDEENITGLSPDALLRRGMCYVAQGRSVFPLLTIMENLKMACFILKDEKMDGCVERAFQRFPILKERRNQLAGSLSGGEQRMLEFARTLMLNPKLIMLDEPSLGLAPKIVNESLMEIERMKDSGVTILLVEQKVKKALEISDYTYILELGKNKLEGESRKFLNERELVKTWLGSEV